MESAQRVVRRSAWFARFPVGIVALSLLLLLHTLIRQNQSHPTGLWKYQLLDVQAAVAAVLASVGAVLARAQYARTIRPALGWFGRVAADIAPDGRLAWTCHVLNGAQDVAVTTSIEYRVTFTPAAKAEGAADFTRWSGWQEAADALRARGLTEDKDFQLDHIGAGRPIPAQGLMFVGWFTEKALADIENISVRLRAVDRAGDTHERVMALMKGVVRVPRHPGASPF
jgi:hypothetical protein